MPTLAEIQNHLEQGYFLDEDIKELGLTGYVSLARMKAEVHSLLTPKQPDTPPVDNMPAVRDEVAKLQVQLEEAQAAERAAIVAQVAAQQQAKVNAAEQFKEAQRVAEEWKAKNVAQTPEKLGPEVQAAS